MFGFRAPTIKLKIVLWSLLTSLADNCSADILLILISVEGSSQPDRFAAAAAPPPGDDVADKVVEPELEELASSRLSGRGGGDAGLPVR